MIALDLTVAELLEILESPLQNGNAELLKAPVKISMDSREIDAQTIFWPLVGAKFDAHNFIADVIQRGALMSIVEQAKTDQIPLCAYIPVDDSTNALLKLARGWQRRFNVKKVAITGSNGKTTTKEMLYAVLNSAMPTIATQGNFNNQIGVPRTLFQINRETQAAIIEMGTNAPGEIRSLTMAAEPNIAIITNVGQSHLEGLGDLAAVAKEKAAIKDGFAKKGVLIINADDPHLNTMRSTTRYKVITFGVQRGQFAPQDLTWDRNACASFRMGRTQFSLQVPGVHNLYNALATIAAATQLGVSKGAIAASLANFSAPGMRMEIRRYAGFKVAVDCYNANPSSMRAALETVANVQSAQRKIAILGDMLELGVNGPNLHREIGRLVPQMNMDLLLTIGELGAEISAGALQAGMNPESVLHFANHALLHEYLQSEVQVGDLILVKASRGMKLEGVVHELEQLQPQSWEND